MFKRRNGAAVLVTEQSVALAATPQRAVTQSTVRAGPPRVIGQPDMPTRELPGADPGARPSRFTPSQEAPTTSRQLAMGTRSIAQVAAAPVSAFGSADRRTLVVGRGISMRGTVQDAEVLVVEGTLEGSSIHAVELTISHGGLLKGEIVVEDAEIAGTIDGSLTARRSLIVRPTGKIVGTARCRSIRVEEGGEIHGAIGMLADDAKPEVALLDLRTPYETARQLSETSPLPAGWSR